MGLSQTDSRSAAVLRASEGTAVSAHTVGGEDAVTNEWAELFGSPLRNKVVLVSFATKN